MYLRPFKRLLPSQDGEQASPDDITVDFKVDELLRSNSKFDLQLSLKTERSPLRRRRMAEYRRTTFLPTSLEMDSSSESKGNRIFHNTSSCII